MMKVPLLSRCLMTMPQLPFDDAASSTGVSVTATLIGCEVGYGSSSKVGSGRRKGNVLVQLRKKIFRSDKNYAAAARQALGLDNTQSSVSQNDFDGGVTKNSIDINCKGLRYPTSSTQSLPPTINSRKQLHVKRDDNNSLPPPTSTRRRLASIDSSSSMMDESCSGSILNDLLMEVYKDPYEDFLHKLKASKTMAGKVEDIEVDVLTQLPAIKATMSPMRTRSSRRLTHQTASSTRAIMSSRSSSNQHVKVGHEKRAPEFSNSVKREKVVGRAKHSSSSSVPGLRTSRCDVDARRGETEHGSFCGREGPTTIRSSRNSSIKSRTLVSQNGSYHGRLEF